MEFYIKMYDQIIWIVYLIICLAVLFGVVNTMLMSVFERVQEIGVLMSIGMSRMKIFTMVMQEAFLLGLLGTIIGLIAAFTAVAEANPADKADMLSASISTAMNTTAFGLMAAIPLLLIHALLQTKTNALVDSLEMASVKFLNAVTERQLKSSGGV